MVIGKVSMRNVIENPVAMIMATDPNIPSLATYKQSLRIVSSTWKFWNYLYVKKIGGLTIAPDIVSYVRVNFTRRLVGNFFCWFHFLSDAHWSENSADEMWKFRYEKNAMKSKNFS